MLLYVPLRKIFSISSCSGQHTTIFRTHTLFSRTGKIDFIVNFHSVLSHWKGGWRGGRGRDSTVVTVEISKYFRKIRFWPHVKYLAMSFTVLIANQSFRRTRITYYGDCVGISRDLSRTEEDSPSSGRWNERKRLCLIVRSLILLNDGVKIHPRFRWSRRKEHWAWVARHS